MTPSRFRRLFRRLRWRTYQSIVDRRVYSPESKAAIIDNFHRLYYGGAASGGTWKNTYWLGTPVRKLPLDLWVYQEILAAVKPDLIIETGTGRGGSAVFLACMCDLLHQGQVITIDIAERSDRPLHDRVTYLHGSSTAPEIPAKVESLIKEYPGKPVVMVILDSGHSKDHVLEELRTYHRLVSPGSYLIVEDTNINGHPVEGGFGAGPMEAIGEFLSGNGQFFVDTEMEKFFLTFNPGGYLKRRAEPNTTPQGASGRRS